MKNNPAQNPKSQSGNSKAPVSPEHRWPGFLFFKHGGFMALIRPDNSVPVPALLKRFALIYLPVVVALSVAILLSARFDDQMRMEKTEVHESNQVEAAKVVIARE